MQKKYFFGIGILLICLAGWGLYTLYRPHHNAGEEEASASLTAADLYHQFLTNETSANQKWVGKVVEVSGSISSVTEAGNYISLNLNASTQGGVDCSILKTDLPADKKPNKGDSITVKGKCTGFLMDVNLVDCVLVK